MRNWRQKEVSALHMTAEVLCARHRISLAEVSRRLGITKPGLASKLGVKRVDEAFLERLGQVFGITKAQMIIELKTEIEKAQRTGRKLPPVEIIKRVAV